MCSSDLGPARIRSLGRGSHHHDLSSGAGARAARTASCTKARRILGHAHVLWEHVGQLSGNVDEVAAEGEDLVGGRQRLAAKAACVVIEEAERAKLLREVADNTLTRGKQRSRLDANPSQRR